jgi:hypothetical protein
MNYSKQYFGKELDQLSYQDIKNFFLEEREETDKIEFKSYYDSNEQNYPDKENGIIKTICGLLNSEGGLIIWGAPVGRYNEEGNKKKFQGCLSPLDKLIEKDNFISRITDSITPSPSGVKFQRIKEKNQNVYVIEVAKSSYSPHQFRNIYYMRIDGQTKPAPHHYIEALFRKVTFPKLAGYIKIDSIKTDREKYIMQISNFIFNKSKLQNEDDIYYRLIVTIGKFALYKVYTGNDRIYTMEGHELRVHNAKATLYYDEPLTSSEIVLFNPNELLKDNNEFQILFYFGGKKSPLMISKYKLKVNDIYTKDTNSLFTSIEENIYAYEYSDKLVISDRDKLQSILGR